ncbi:MAG: universal stress protein [Armatimonadetes bacterium]|nr:universal stress protein [Armatimonadota bacterium]
MKILLATDGSGEARAVRIFLTALDPTRVTAVRVLSVITAPNAWVGPYVDSFYAGPQALERILEEERRAAASMAEGEVEALRSAGFQAEPDTMVGDAAETILAAARAWEADLVVLGHRGLSGLQEILLGSVASNVARHADRPVLLARAPTNGLRRVLLATDGSPNAARAMEFAARLPLPAASEFVLLTVVKPYHPFPGLFPTNRTEFEQTVREVRHAQRRAAEALVEEVRASLATADRPVATSVREGDPAGEIIAAMHDHQADLLVIGARGASGLRGLLVGSVADRLLRRVEGSLLIVH